MMFSTPSPTLSPLPTDTSSSPPVGDGANKASSSPMLDLLYPLSEFFRRGEARPVTKLETGRQSMPEPYRSLLVHGQDMTSTLERFHGERLRLRLLASLRQGDSLFRRVVLVGDETAKAVELGAIRIDLAAFEAAARARILASEQPLGSILKEFAVPYVSKPRLFFRVASDGAMEGALDLAQPARLYGRQNVLSTPRGHALAEVVEILPPVAEPSAGGEEGPVAPVG